MSNDAFTSLTERLRERLCDPLPGVEAQLRMAPAYRQNRTLARVDDKPCREAGVLALLFPDEEDAHLVLTARRPDLRDHAGQVSFPGGRREPEESLRETALREAHEEVGLVPASVDVLGTLTPLYIPPSNYCVYPFVGAVAERPELFPTDAEVAAIIHAPLSHLLRPVARRVEPWTLRGRTVDVPFFDVDGYQVWGATAMMLAELLTLLDEVTADTESG